MLKFNHVNIKCASKTQRIPLNQFNWYWCNDFGVSVKNVKKLFRFWKRETQNAFKFKERIPNQRVKLSSESVYQSIWFDLHRWSIVSSSLASSMRYCVCVRCQSYFVLYVSMMATTQSQNEENNNQARSK